MGLPVAAVVLIGGVGVAVDRAVVGPVPDGGDGLAAPGIVAALTHRPRGRRLHVRLRVDVFRRWRRDRRYPEALLKLL